MKIAILYDVGERGDYVEDAKRIQKIFRDKGYYITLEQACKLWERYCASMLAGWLHLFCSDEHLFKSTKLFWRESSD